MRAVLLVERKSPATLKAVNDFPIPVPGPGQVRVKVFSAGVNPVDYKIADGLFGPPNLELPRILGVDVAGVIDAIGDHVTKWKPGARVYYLADPESPFGGFAEYSIARADALVPLPSGISFHQAAAIPCAGWTAYKALFHKMHARVGQTILITAGSGGVGGFAIQLAKAAGLTVITTCSKENFEYVTRLGAHHTIDYHTDDISGRIKLLTGGEGVDLWLDCISDESATMGMSNLKLDGQLTSIAGMVKWDDHLAGEAFSNATSLHYVFLAALYRTEAGRAELVKIGTEMGELYEKGKLAPPKLQVVPLETGVAKAFQLLREHHVVGKLVVEVVPEL